MGLAFGDQSQQLIALTVSLSGVEERAFEGALDVVFAEEDKA